MADTSKLLMTGGGVGVESSAVEAAGVCASAVVAVNRKIEKS